MSWEDELRADLAALRDEPGPTAVAARVMERLERPRVRWWMWAWAPAAAALLVLLWPRAAEVDVAPPASLVRTAAPPRFAYEKSAVRKAQVEAHDTQFMRIVTDDPDVVILWSLETKGDIQ